MTNLRDRSIFNGEDTSDWNAKRTMAGVFGYRWLYLDDSWIDLKYYTSKFLPIAPIANANVRASWNVPGAVHARSGRTAPKIVPPLMDSSSWHTTNFAKSPRSDYNAPSPFSKGITLGNDMVLFDLPKPDYGVPSLGMLQHLNFSPFMWHPSYTLGKFLCGHSL